MHKIHVWTLYRFISTISHKMFRILVSFDNTKPILVILSKVIKDCIFALRTKTICIFTVANQGCSDSFLVYFIPTRSKMQSLCLALSYRCKPVRSSNRRHILASRFQLSKRLFGRDINHSSCSQIASIADSFFFSIHLNDILNDFLGALNQVILTRNDKEKHQLWSGLFSVISFTEKNRKEVYYFRQLFRYLMH